MANTIDIGAVERVHFIGVGGIGMSALARFFLHEKKRVSGSDRTLTDLTKALANEGVQVMTPQVAENITDDIQLIVYTEAMTEDQEEMVAARGLGVPMLNYFQALGLVANPYYLIAVAGTHGKTTTTAMLIDIFEAAGKDPTGIVGSLRASTKSNFRPGKSKYAIVEACEYRQDFLALRPDVLVVTNLEHDHVDYYPDLAAVQKTFKAMIDQINDGGVLVTNPNDPNIAPILTDYPGTIIDYTKHLDLQLPLKHPGLHNRYNAAAALAVAKHEKLSVTDATTTLGTFAGTWRRFEFKGYCNGAPVYDDYAHHPTAIEAVVAGARELHPDRRVVLVFEPHMYSRTAGMFDQFARALALADRTIVLPIYGAREENVSGVTSRELAVKALEYNQNVAFMNTYEEVVQVLRGSVVKSDVVLVAGAGPVTKLAQELTQ